MESGTEYSESLNRASGFLFSDDLEKAIDETNKALAAEPDNPGAICMFGLLAYRMDDAGLRLTLIERDPKLGPGARASPCPAPAPARESGTGTYCRAIGQGLAGCLHFTPLIGGGLGTAETIFGDGWRNAPAINAHLL